MNRFQLIAVIVCGITTTSVLSQQPDLTIVGMPANAPALVSAKKIVVKYGNKFRFDLSPQTTQTPIGAAALPSALGPSAAEIAKLPASIAGPVAHAEDVGDPLVAQGASITKTWNNIRQAIEDDQNELGQIRRVINTTIRNAAKEQRCYAQQAWNFRQPILTEDQAKLLFRLAQANIIGTESSGGCYVQGFDDWPLDSADKLEIDLSKQQQALSDLATAKGYPSWVNSATNQDVNTALVKQVADLVAVATSYSTGSATVGADSGIAQTYLDFQNVVANNKQWRMQLSNLTSLDSLKVDIAVDPCVEWYGKGRTDTIKLHAVDLSSGSGASQDIQLATNTCNPRTIASTGIGVSFLSNPTYTFLPSDNAGTQVIGQAAVNKQMPLYAVLYNIQLADLKHGVELFASPGVGLTSSSDTTNGDFLGGFSFSFARRVLFITPSADFGRRDQLVPGFKIGSAKGSLTSVPTQSHWPVGFMISVSFGIGPS